MIGRLSGNFCWCCERTLTPAIAQRPHQPSRDPQRHQPDHSGVVAKKQFGPRYCSHCIRNGLRLVALKARQVTAAFGRRG